MAFKTDKSGVIKEEVTVGDIISSSDEIISNAVLIKKYQAKIEELQARNASILVEAKKQSVPENLTYDEKKKLIMSGAKKPKDFPGDDWSGIEVVGENGV